MRARALKGYVHVIRHEAIAQDSTTVSVACSAEEALEGVDQRCIGEGGDLPCDAGGESYDDFAGVGLSGKPVLSLAGGSPALCVHLAVPLAG